MCSLKPFSLESPKIQWNPGSPRSPRGAEGNGGRGEIVFHNHDINMLIELDIPKEISLELNIVKNIVIEFNWL